MISQSDALMADFFAKKIGLDLARCAQYSPDLGSPYYIRACFSSFDNLMGVVKYNLGSRHLDAILLALKKEDAENGDYGITDYILKESREWFNVMAPIRYEKCAIFRPCKIVRHSRRARGLLKAS